MPKKNRQAEKSRGNALKLVAILFVIFITAIPAYVVLMGEEPASPPPPKTQKPQDFIVFSDMPNTHETGKAKMTVFFDFYCPACFRFYIYELDLKKQYGDKLEVTNVGYPIFGEKSWLPLEAYELAKEQGMGEAMEIALFFAYHQERKNISDPKFLLELAGNLSLNTSQFEADLKSRRMKGKIQENILLGNKYKLEATPTVIIDGQVKIANLTIENVEKAIAGALAN